MSGAPDDGRMARLGAALGARLTRLVARRSVRLFLSFLSGTGLALAYPPYDILPALAAYAVLLILMEAGERVARRPLVERALLGAAFGFGFHLMGLWWIGAAFLVEADRYAVLLPFAVIGLPILLAPFTALATALTGFAPPTIAWRAVALALALSFTEWLRGLVLTGFPWNAAGVGVTQTTLLAQSAAAVGVNGLAIVAVLLGALPAAFVEARSRWLGIPAGIALAAMAGFGAYRLLTIPPTPADAPIVHVVQPSVPQADKWRPELRIEIWERLLALTRRGAGDAAAPYDVVVWPETAIPFLYRTPSAEQVALAEALAPHATLVTGAHEAGFGPDGERQNFNTVLVFRPDGTLAERYDKVRLVPFGEYLPLERLMARLGLKGLVEGAGSFVAGSEPQTIAHEALPPFQPLICYEALFPHFEAEAPAAWIVNVTNDGWFGNTPGPRQHLRHASLRAVERGLPLVRSANTGISAIFDSAGRAVDMVPLNLPGTITAPLPAARSTPYAIWGDKPLYVVWFVGILWIASARRRARRRASGG